MSNFRSKITIACIVASVIAAVSTIPILSYAQQQTNFVATLTGKNVVPPIDTPATGTAKFHVNPNGTLSYEVDVNNIADVVGVPIKLKDGAELANLLNVYATVNQKSFTQSLGPVSGKLASGILTANDIYGPLIGKNITDLMPFFANKSAYVIVRTTPHQQGEIQGQILPAGMNKTAPAAGMNATTAPPAPTTAAPAPTTAPPAPTTAAPAPTTAPPAPTTAPPAPTTAAPAPTTAAPAPTTAPPAPTTAAPAPTTAAPAPTTAACSCSHCWNECYYCCWNE